MNQPAICTIVSNNYLAFARVLASSFREHHPDGRVWVLIVDRRHPDVEYEHEDFDVIFAEDLGIPNFGNFAFRYSILELNTAVKPSLIAHLQERHGVERLCYFDPDILITGSLDPLFDELAKYDVLLTPHITEPLTDHALPGERDFLLSGIYNLGFLAISLNERTLPFLSWWRDRLARFCVHRVSDGLFVDQKWMDFAPAFLERAEVLRDPCYNMAYWNLSHRRLESTADGHRVEGEALRFFHFSGYSYDKPQIISKYQNRFRLEDRPDLGPIFAEYRRRLEAAGHETFRDLPYAYARFDNGVPVPDVARQAMQIIDWKGERWPDPFDSSRPDSFFDWLLEPVALGNRGRVPRLAMVLWDHRADLQKAFDQPTTRDAVAFARWFREEVARQPDLDDRCAEVVELPHPPRRARAKAASDNGVATTEPARDLLSSLLSRSLERLPTLSRGEVRWLSEEASMQPSRSPLVPRLAMLIRRNRYDLSTAFPDPLGDDRSNFALWYATCGRQEYRLSWPLVAPVLRSLPLRRGAYATAWWLRQRTRRRARQEAHRAQTTVPIASSAKATHRSTGPTRSALEGVNVVGWTDARTGVGEICRATLDALDGAGVPHADWPLRHPVGEANEPTPRAVPSGLPFATTLFHVNADMMEWVEHQLPLSARSGQYRIGYWFWELSYFPRELADAFRHVDEVWAPSRFCQRAFSSLSPVPVHWVPPAVRPVEVAGVNRDDFGLSERAFHYLFIFDALSIPERKNPLGLLEAFRTAVDESDEPLHLVIKVGNSRGRADVVEELERRAAGLPVTLIHRSLARQELLALIATCNAYVSLHRSEGLGLPLIESMFLGRPVIATGYGGCTDFLDDTTGWPVPSDLTTLQQPQGPYPAGAVWADPDPAAASELMLEVLRRPEEAAARTRAARRRVKGLYSPRVAAERFRAELTRLSREGAGSVVRAGGADAGARSARAD